MISCQLWTIWLLSAVISTFKAYLLFLCMHRVIMARGAPGLQFRSLILHLYQTPGGKQAQNRHDLSNPSWRFIPCVSLSMLLWSITNRLNAINRHLRLSIRLLSIRPFHHAKAAPLKSSSKGSPRQLWFKERHIRDPLCIRSVPLNPAALMCHILAPSSALIPTLFPCPMEVIRRALFMLNHRGSRSKALQVSCLMFSSLCGSAGDAQKLLGSKNHNNDE